jgi:3',5'-cyclic AMP phosphodiesterase CpdA
MATKKIRIVCISDTHNTAPGEGFMLPKGDILIHAGDLTNQGTLPEFRKAVAWLEKADYAVKIVVAGNHDLSLDEKYSLKHSSGWRVEAEPVAECQKLVREAKGVTYLDHASATIRVHDTELRVFGSPYSPDRGKQNWAFQYAAEEADDIWSAIPDDTDLLITHTPSNIALDQSSHWTEGGCPALSRRLAHVRPLLHVFGHCHEGRGAAIARWDADGDAQRDSVAWQDPGEGNKKQSLFDLTAGRGGRPLEGGRKTAMVNTSIMAKSWGRGGKAFNKPIVVDLELPVIAGGV